MKPLIKFDDKYFLRYKVKPVKIKPYDHKQKEIANKLVLDLKKSLCEYEQIKEKFKYSRREYQIQKSKFFIKVSEIIPDSYLEVG